jgi:DUF1009 family protein
LTGRLGVIAGAGPLPARIVEAARAQGRDVFVLALEGIAEAAALQGVAHDWVRLGAIGRALDLLRQAAVTDVVLAGPVSRPSLGALGLDARGLRMLASLGLGARGDDRILSRIVAELEGEGFAVRAIDDVLGGTRVGPGPLGRHAPDDGAAADIALGVRAARALGALDIGQAVVVQQGLVLGVEAVEGTDALLARAGALRKEGPGGVLVKLAKPGQEMRVDRPTIGPGTIEGARAAGLRGIAVQAGGTLLVEAERVRTLADEAGLFVIGVEPDPA